MVNCLSSLKFNLSPAVIQCLYPVGLTAVIKKSSAQRVLPLSSFIYGLFYWLKNTFSATDLFKPALQRILGGNSHSWPSFLLLRSPVIVICLDQRKTDDIEKYGERQGSTCEFTGGCENNLAKYYSFVAAGSPTCIWSREKSIFKVQVRREIDLWMDI